MSTAQEHIHATSIASWSLALSQALDSYGLESRAVFNNAGIDLGTIKSPYDRLPVKKVQQVWRYAAEHSDEYFGLTVSTFLNSSSFHALGYALVASANLQDLLERLIRYRCVISHSFFAELLDEGEYMRLSTTDERKLKTSVTQDALYGFIIKLASQAKGASFVPNHVCIDREPKSNVERLKEVYGLGLEFNTEKPSMLISKTELQRPLLFSDAELAQRLDTLVESYIAELGLVSEYMMRVENEIRGLLEQGDVSMNAVADSLHVTVRTLQRRLKDENSSYQLLLDRVRKRMAMEWMSDTQMNATQIAFKLGFNDSSSFARAFKGWTGQSFSQYRKSQ